MEIMDVNDATVKEAFERHGVIRMIHGHTHRPAVHQIPLQKPGIDTAEVRRIVLGDWGKQLWYGVISSTGVRLEKAPLRIAPG